MIEMENALVIDIDGSLCPIKSPGQDYAELIPEPLMLAKLHALHADGWYIVLSNSLGMRSQDGNPGKIAKYVGPTLLTWLAKHYILIDELQLAKPWLGRRGVYVDDRAVRPREFVEMDIEELEVLMTRDRLAQVTDSTT